MSKLVTGGVLLLVIGVLVGCGGSSSTEATITTGGIHQTPTKAGHSYNGSEEAGESDGQSQESAGGGTSFDSGYELCELHGVVAMMYAAYGAEESNEVACEPDPAVEGDLAVANWWFPGIAASALNHGGAGRINVTVLTDKTPYVDSFWEQQKEFLSSEPEMVEVSSERPNGHEALWINREEMVTEVGEDDIQVWVYPDLDNEVLPTAEEYAAKVTEEAEAKAFG
jgi:hypothetical protein